MRHRVCLDLPIPSEVLKRPVAQGDLGDGTTYRLWQITGDFKNDYDLHHYPADRQTLVMRFIEYGFYAFFALCLLCIVSVLAAERLRGAGRQSMAITVERSGRNLFAAGFVAMLAAGWLVYTRW
ncbi:MAG: hypothetical protein ABSA58_07835 [Acetobacteraceae bacterium]